MEMFGKFGAKNRSEKKRERERERLDAAEAQQQKRPAFAGKDDDEDASEVEARPSSPPPCTFRLGLPPCAFYERELQVHGKLGLRE